MYLFEIYFAVKYLRVVLLLSNKSRIRRSNLLKFIFRAIKSRSLANGRNIFLDISTHFLGASERFFEMTNFSGISANTCRGA